MLVHSGVQLVAEVVFAILLGPGGIGIVTSLLPDRPDASGGRSASGRLGALTAEGTSDASIRVPCFITNPDASICRTTSANRRYARSSPIASRKRHSVE